MERDDHRLREGWKRSTQEAERQIWELRIPMTDPKDGEKPHLGARTTMKKTVEETKSLTNGFGFFSVYSRRGLIWHINTYPSVVSKRLWIHQKLKHGVNYNGPKAVSQNSCLRPQVPSHHPKYFWRCSDEEARCESMWITSPPPPHLFLQGRLCLNPRIHTPAPASTPGFENWHWNIREAKMRVSTTAMCRRCIPLLSRDTFHNAPSDISGYMSKNRNTEQHVCSAAEWTITTGTLLALAFQRPICLYWADTTL